MEDESEAERVAWEEASRREAVVRDLLKGHPKRLETIKAVETAGWEPWAKPGDDAYRVIEQFRLTPTVSGLLPGARGRPKGFPASEGRAVKRRSSAKLSQCEYLTPTRPAAKTPLSSMDDGGFRQEVGGSYFARPFWRRCR